MKIRTFPLLLIGCVSLEHAPAAPVDFVHEIRPLFEMHGVRCHGAEKQKGGQALGLPLQQKVVSHSGRPFTLADKGKPIMDVFA